MAQFEITGNYSKTFPGAFVSDSDQITIKLNACWALGIVAIVVKDGVIGNEP